MDYSSGLVGVYTLKPKENTRMDNRFSKYPRDENRDYYHAALLPCDPFLKAFERPGAFADLLETKASNVVVEWPVLNYGVAPESRIMAERYFTLYRNTYQGDRGSAASAIYEMQISSYGYTMAAQRVPVPEPLRLRDLKASLSLFSRPDTFINSCFVICSIL